MNAGRLAHFKRGRPVTIEVNGRDVTTYEGETIATALLAAGFGVFYAPDPTHFSPSRLFCGMGVCMQCLVTIDGNPSLRACQVTVKSGMKVETNQ